MVFRRLASRRLLLSNSSAPRVDMVHELHACQQLLVTLLHSIIKKRDNICSLSNAREKGVATLTSLRTPSSHFNHIKGIINKDGSSLHWNTNVFNKCDKHVVKRCVARLSLNTVRRSTQLKLLHINSKYQASNQAKVHDI